MNPATTGQCLKECVDTPYGESCRRVLLADAEELARGGIRELFREAAPLLAECGARSDIPVQEYLLKGYTIVTYTVETDQGTPIEIYDSSLRDKFDAWEHATNVAHIILNLRLKKAGVPERFYRVYFANDQLFVLLTPDMLQAFRSSGLPIDYLPQELPEPLK